MVKLPHVAIIVLNWNGLNDTLDCLESLACLDYPNYEIVVVDNGSTDGSVEAMRRHFPNVTLIENDENLGYAEGNNRGVEYALRTGADYIFVLNNDTILSQDILTRLVVVADANPRVGAVGPKIYYYAQPRRIWFAGGIIDWQRGVTVNLGAGEEDIGQFEQVKSVDFLAGCALLTKRETWKNVGSFDSRFFMYWEETDWCTRARRAGYDLLLVPQAKMWHKVSLANQTSSPRILYYMTRNRLLFLHKNLSFPHKVIVMTKCSWGVCRTIVSFLRRGKREQGGALMRGIFDFFRGQFGQVSIISGRGFV
jgi:GT2 family glycosyltransferase